jgi:hypothetical protein
VATAKVPGSIPHAQTSASTVINMYTRRKECGGGVWHGRRYRPPVSNFRIRLVSERASINPQMGMLAMVGSLPLVRLNRVLNGLRYKYQGAGGIWEYHDPYGWHATPP